MGAVKKFLSKLVPARKKKAEVVRISGVDMIAVDPSAVGIKSGSFDHGAIASQANAVSQLSELPSLRGVHDVGDMLDRGASLPAEYHERMDAGLPVISKALAEIVLQGAPRVGEMPAGEFLRQEKLSAEIKQLFGVDSFDELDDQQKAFMALQLKMIVLALRPMANAIAGHVNHMAGVLTNEQAHQYDMILMVDRFVGRRAKKLAKREYESHERELRQLVPDARKSVSEYRKEVALLRQEIDALREKAGDVIE